MLTQHYSGPDNDPVPHQRKEVLENLKKMVAACDGADEIDEHDDADPEVARHHFAIATKDLGAERGGVGAGDIVGYDTQRDDDATEFAKATNRAIAL